MRPAHRPAACRETTPRQEKIPVLAMSEILEPSEGHRPAHSRPALPTREYEPGSGDSHDPAPARRPHPPRPPPGPGTQAGSHAAPRPEAARAYPQKTPHRTRKKQITPPETYCPSEG
jgi:hypothetical protein